MENLYETTDIPDGEEQSAMEDATVPCEFTCGCAGSGKTYYWRERIKDDPTAGVLAATTGIAAVNLGTTTLNSLLRFFDTDSLRDAYLNGSLVRRMKDLREDYRRIVIDECFHYKQRILTEHGWRYIGAIVRQQQNIRVWSYSLAHGLELKPVVGWLAKRLEGNLIRICASRTKTTRRGARLICCTPNHKILTAGGYKEAGRLQVGDTICVRGKSLNPEQWGLVIGSLMGDAGLSNPEKRKSPQLKFVQGQAQLGYLEYKRAVLGELAGGIYSGKSGYKPDSKVYQFTMKVVDELYTISDNMQREGRHWNPTDRFISWIDVRALAYWFADDGSIKWTRANRPAADIHTPPFSLERHEALVRHLHEKFNLPCKPIGNGNGGYKLAFGVEATERLLDLIAPFVPPCMSYKVPKASAVAPMSVIQSEIHNAEIRSIEAVAPDKKHGYVFDIEVADNHNYIAGNVVVSNCSMMDGDQLGILVRALLEVNSWRSAQPPLGLTLVGDFAQLPPVKARWAFESDEWHRFDGDATTRLTKVWRQGLGPFLDALNFARSGDGSSAADLLSQCGLEWHTSLSLDFDGTTIVSKNDQVDRYNGMALDRLPGPTFTLQSRRWGKSRGEWKQVPERITLKHAAYVMLLANKYDDEGAMEYANGDCGHIEEHTPYSLRVRLLRNDRVVEVEQVTRDVGTKQKPTGQVMKGDGCYLPQPHWWPAKKRWVEGQVQFWPIRLAYASTVHKSQGLSLDRCQIDIRDQFFGQPAMAYVALSRCRTLEGLRIVGQAERFVKQCNTDPRIRRWL